MGEMAEGFQRHKSVTMRYRDACPGEGLLLDSLTQHGECRGEGLVLMIQSWDECANVVHGFGFNQQFLPEGL
jgi:hypothetical protein